MNNGLKVLILGNGFDLNHGLKTSYSDFRKYLKKHHFTVGREDLFDFLEYQSSDLWKDFEEELGKLSFESPLDDSCDEIKAQEQNDREFETLSQETTILSEFESFKTTIANAMNDWILEASASLDCIHQKSFHKNLIDKADLIVNFNYSETVEKVYSVPSKKILHIHGIARERRVISDHHDPMCGEKEDSNIIVGHSGSIAIQKYKSSSLQTFYVEILKDYALNEEEILKELTKNTIIGLERLKTALGSRKVESLDTVGHSLGVVDLPYFKFLNDCATSNSKCRYWSYEKKGKDILKTLDENLPCFCDREECLYWS